MPLVTNPLTAIIPVVTVTKGTNEVHELWGTAFLVAPGIFMSAGHVLDVYVPDGQALSVILSGDEGVDPILVPTDLIYSDPTRDIAIVRVTGWPRSDSLRIADDDRLIMNNNILTVEYSEPDRGIPLDNGRTGISIVPSWHKGYMVREYIARFGHLRPTACLDLSFPALKGASGAPVIDERTGLVLGMIVGNTERVLLPTQIAPVTRGDTTVNEVRYFAPYGRAIKARYLRNALAECQRSHPDVGLFPNNPA